MTYRKWGRAVRWENGALVRVDEAGEAWEENGVFFTRPIEHSVVLSREEREEPDVVADRILRSADAAVSVERLIVVHGAATHECDGVRWSDTTDRVHVALTRKPWRVLVDDAAAVGPASMALARCEGERTFERVRLGPGVAAALLPRLPCAREQQAGGVDGLGHPIEHRRVEGAPPNVYRPSYRVRPVAAWFNLCALPFGDFDPAAPLAVALLDAETPAALVDDGGRTFLTRLRAERVLAVSESGEILI